MRVERLGKSIVVDEVIEQLGAGRPKKQLIRPEYLFRVLR